MVYYNYYIRTEPATYLLWLEGWFSYITKSTNFTAQWYPSTRNNLALIYQGFEITVLKFAIEVNEI